MIRPNQGGNYIRHNLQSITYNLSRWYGGIISLNPATFINTVHIANWYIILLKILPSICDDHKSTCLLRSNCLKYSLLGAIDCSPIKNAGVLRKPRDRATITQNKRVNYSKRIVFWSRIEQKHNLERRSIHELTRVLCFK